MSGRPSKYKPEFAAHAEKLCQLGATDIEVADFFAVDVRTVYRWKHEHDGFCQALNAGKDKADQRVVNSLYQRAVGYEQDAVKIFMPANAAAPVYADYREKIAPDTTAAIFWLKNRQPELWRDKQEIEHGGSVKHTLMELTDEQLAAIATGGGTRAAEKAKGKRQPN